MASTKVTYSIIANDRFSRVADKIKRSSLKMRRSFGATGDAAKKLSKDMRAMGQSIRQVGAIMSVASAALIALGLAAVNQAGKFEQFRVAFDTLTGSAAKGKQLFQDLTTFAAKTPFELEGIASAAKTLVAFGTESKDVTTILGALGNIVSGTGKGTLDGLARIFGKIQVKGKLTGEEMEGLATKGVNLREAIGTKFGASTAQVEVAMSKGLIKFEMVRDVMIDMSREGGMFFGLMEKQSKTTLGLWSNLQDAFTVASAALGDVIIEFFNLNGVLEDLSGFFDGATAFFREHPTITKVALALAAVLAVMGPLVLMAGAAVSAFGFMALGAATLGVTVGAVSLTILGIAGAIGLAVTAGGLLIANWDKIALAWQFLTELIVEKWKGVTDTVGDFFSGRDLGVFDFTGDMDVTANSSIDMQIGVTTPAGTAANVKTSSSGSPLKVGVNNPS